MLERMWGPTLGIDKMAEVTKHKKQKVQLFEAQIGFKLPSCLFESLECHFQLFGKTCDPCMTHDPCMEWSSVWGKSLLAAPESSSRQAWSAGACVVLLGLTLAGPQIRGPGPKRSQRRLHKVTSSGFGVILYWLRQRIVAFRRGRLASALSC